MSALDSNLSSQEYGYDFVVATSQASINATMKLFFSSGSMPVQNICYIAGEDGNLVPIDYEQLKQDAGGADPFAIPNDADPETNEDLKNLIKARFMVGFRAQIGLPPGYAPADVPDIVELGSDTAAVTFNLMCSEFSVVQLIPGGGYSPKPTWMNQKQPDGKAWLFTSRVDLRMFATADSAYNKLPPAVQKAIQNLGSDAFSVQQLLFDLDNAGLQSIPVMSGVEPGTQLYNVLQQDFLGAYFNAMKKNGMPILGCTIEQAPADPSPIKLSNVNLQVSPLLNSDGTPISNPTPADRKQATLGYLCAVNNNAPHPPRPFGWNYVDSGVPKHGVIAINRNTLTNFFEKQLTPWISKHCYLTYSKVTGGPTLFDPIIYSWYLTPYQFPTITRPSNGSTVLKYSWSSNAYDTAGAFGGNLGKLRLNTTMNCSVEFTGNKIVVRQHLVVYLYVEVISTGAGGNVIDKQITDTYTISVDENGQLISGKPKTDVIDTSETPSRDGFLDFFTGINKLIEDIAKWLRGYAGTDIANIPLSFAQGFVFPGGDTFTYNDVGFSEYQDLVSAITYADPRQVYLSTPEMIAGSSAIQELPATKT